MNPTQTGKTIFFLYGILVLLVLGTLLNLFRHTKRINVSLIDFIHFSWFFFIITKSILQKEPFSLFYVEFLGLALLYFILRLLKPDYYKWLFVAVIAGGTIQAICGNLQLCGYYPSHHNLFKLTGSFFNPGPYAGYLVSIFPAALGFWLFRIKLVNPGGNHSNSYLKITQAIQNVLNYVIQWFKKTEVKINISDVKNPVAHNLNSFGYYLSAITLICILLVLPTSQSRAGWLAALGASAYLFVVKYKNAIHSWLNKSVARKYSMVVLFVVVLLSGFTGMYFMKKGSADGRLLIWKVTTNMIADHPLTGTGLNGFKAHYMDYQAEYFQQNPDSEEAMVAGDTNYAFNEFLQQTAQHGLPGGIILIIIFAIALSVKSSNRNCNTGDIKSIKKQTQTFSENQLVVISKAVLVSVFIFSMFSYPIQILPIKTNLILALAYLGYNMKPMFTSKLFSADKPQPILKLVTKLSVLIVVIIIAFYGIRYTKRHTKALKSWKLAFTLYEFNATEHSLREYDKAFQTFQNDGEFLTHYGKALSIGKEYEKSIEILKNATIFYPNTFAYNALGDSYRAIGKCKEAEAAYIYSCNMNPSRFYPMYLLAKLYYECGKKDQAIEIAGQLLYKEIKIHSKAIDEIRTEMRKIINLNVN